MYKHDLFLFTTSVGSVACACRETDSYNQITANTVCKILLLLKPLHQNKVLAPTVTVVHSSYNTTFCIRSKTHSKTSSKTIGVNFRLGRVI